MTAPGSQSPLVALHVCIALSVLVAQDGQRAATARSEGDDDSLDGRRLRRRR